ncbi:NlpC/P60 family peptidoglycan-binding protein RipD [Mycobacterium sp.]|uniref:NlpC/P60 family peptidoglycan-binding protein RipD n=1 Tax=Mycobacterium sp. TaxID=1785 RepID=UPI00128A87BF|nr:NlpC/P60 family peptidoglycan-binding protein RipD [Mycobacterium sp.]KAA8964531.1 MAG: NlpC/P60 family peptidoglycan-binding protein RipD [Mycobacterium sp.]
MRSSYAVAAGLAVMTASLVSPALAAAVPNPWPSGYGQPIEIVIQRALSQRGMPYVYGGGNAAGPTNGIRQSSSPGAGTLPAPVPGGAGVLPGIFPAPTTGANPGAGTSPATVPGTVGFDSSGLIQYAFAGAGIKMPRTSGEQCNVGRKVPPAQARRGDLICYGPGGSQSVALYLGNGQMIEATEPVVTVSAARTTNMTPYLTRIIES